MKLLGFLLLLTCTSKPTLEMRYMKATANSQVVFCGLAVMEFEYNKSSLHLKSQPYSIDLVIVSRSQEYWLGVDPSDGRSYKLVQLDIQGDSYGLMIYPEDPNEIQITIHPSKQLCNGY